MSQTIKSTAGFIKRVFDDRPPADTAYFYRGHSDREEFLIQPSAFRRTSEKGVLPEARNHLQNEHLMYRELLAQNPGDFAEDHSTFEKLVRMQHHGLPTRLLDITSNPLMALYFAASGCPGKKAEVLVFKVKRQKIKFFDSDTVSVVANLARMEYDAKLEISRIANQPGISVDDFNRDNQVKRLLHMIGEEKPYFRPIIQPAHISSILCVKGKMSNSRVLSQAGLFLLFGHEASIETQGPPDVEVNSIFINPNDKERILKDLDALNINNATVFPYLESSAKHIKEAYKSA